MPRIKVNLDEISDTFALLEPGKYVAKLVDVEEQESSKGNDMLVWIWEIPEGEYRGKQLKSYTVLMEDNLRGLKEHLQAFGLKGTVDFNTDKLINKKAKLTVSVAKVKSRETGEDMEVNRVVRVDVLKANGNSGSSPASAVVSKGDSEPEDDFPL